MTTKTKQGWVTIRAVAILFAVVLPSPPVMAQDHVDISSSLSEAMTLLFGDDPDEKAAEAVLSTIRQVDPDNPTLNALDVFRRYTFGGHFLPPLQHARQVRAVEQVLSVDSTNAVAHMVRGMLELDLYRRQMSRVTLPVRFTQGNVIDGLLGFLDARRDSNMDFGIVHDPDRELTLAARSRYHLERAASVLDTPAARGFLMAAVELALRMKNPAWGLGISDDFIAHNAEHAIGHHMRALFLMIQDRYTDAADAAEVALSLMTPDSRTRVLDATRISRPSAEWSDEDWLDRDPLWKTAENERLAEHMARLVMADLLFGGPDTDGGRMIVRYGLYDRSVRFSSDRDDFLALEYASATYVFHDMAKTGEWIFWSASAADLTGPRSVAPQWERDFTIKAKEEFESTPYTSSVDLGKVKPFSAQVFSFRNGLETDVVVVHRFPSEWPETAIQVGLYGADNNQPSPHANVLAEWIHEKVDSTDRMGVHTVSAPALYDRYSVEAETGGVIGVSRHTGLSEQGYAPALSDIVLARLVADAMGDEVPDGFFRRGDRLIEPLLPAHVESTQDVHIYFEVEHAATSVDVQSFQVDATLVPVSAPNKPAVSVSFSEDVVGQRWERDLILDLDGVENGAYYLIVRVTDIAGNTPSMTRSAELQVGQK